MGKSDVGEGKITSARVRLFLIDQFQVLFVAVLMIEQVNFMSPPPIPPSSS